MRSPAAPSLKNSSLRRRISRYLPLILWMGFISYASTAEFSAINTSRFIGPLVQWLWPGISDERLLLVHFITRKAAHFCEYAILGFLAARALSSSSRMILQRHWFSIALSVIGVYAFLDEFHQSFVPSRTASVYDSLIDICGALVALTSYRIFKVPKARDQLH